MVGGGVEILRGAAISLDQRELGVARIHQRTAEAEQLRKNLTHGLGMVGVYLEPQVGRLGIGAPNAKLLHFETPLVFHHGVEDLFHDVRVDQVTLGLHPFFERDGRARGIHSLNYRIPMPTSWLWISHTDPLSRS